METQQQLRAVRDLPFCYACGKDFTEDDEVDHDHVPAETVFAKHHREPLKLRTHKACNHGNHGVDEKIGQLIALRRGTAPRPEHRQLRFSRTNIGPALINLDVDAAVWRWITGFHAALYRTPLRFQLTGEADPPYFRSLVLPFPKGSRITRAVEPLRIQHVKFVEAIKVNRHLRNVDRIECNKGQLIYECVWDRFDHRNQRCCIFALNVCDWKDLGAVGPGRAQGCAGVYMPEGGATPPGAASARRSSLILPNLDPLDPFAP